MGKKKNKKKPWGRRVFLNSPLASDTGWLHGTIRYPPYHKGYPQIELTAADCHRQITLTFSPEYSDDSDEYPGESKKARLRKIRRLRRTINEFCDAATNAIITAEKDPPKPKEEDKKT